MSEVVRLRTRAEIEEEAAAWIWRMEEASQEEDRQAFEAWLRQDPRHRRAVEELTKVWDSLDGLAGTPRVAALPPHSSEAIHGGQRRWWWAAAAVLVVALGTVAWLQRGNETQTLATAVGQHRNVALSDGTMVTLNTNTILETDFGRHSREIHLRKGEAHFEVAPDRSRPFLVHAGDAVVQAIGTGFEVRLRSDRHVDVLVNEGRVEVRTDAPSLAQNASAGSATPLSVVTVRALSAGQQLSTATTD